MNLKELRTILSSKDRQKRTESLVKFREGKFGLEALPLLRELMTEEDVSVVIHAIECVAKLGPEALTCPAGQTYSDPGKNVPGELEWQLVVLGGRIWGYSLYANCYSACLAALVKLEADEDQVVEYIHNHIGLVNPDDFLESLQVLLGIKTKDARDLAKRAVAFWRPELDKTHTKKLEKILAKSK